MVRFLGGPVTEPAAFLGFVRESWPAIEPEMLVRATQTNEAGRCALLLPVLAELPHPLRARGWRLRGPQPLPGPVGYRYPPYDSAPAHRCWSVPFPAGNRPRRFRVVGGPASTSTRSTSPIRPTRLPGRADLAEHAHRRARLAPARIAAADPPLLVRGDLVDDLPALAARAPTGATLVVFHTSVLIGAGRRRQSFTDLVRDLPGHWISVENTTTFPYGRLPTRRTRRTNVLALDGRPLAWCRPHGQALTWF